MDLAEQIRTQWVARHKELEMVWWLLPQLGQGIVATDVATKLQARIINCLLMTPFSPESGREVGKQLAEQFKFHVEKLGRLQGELAEQFLVGLEAEQVAWLAPRLIAFGAEITVGFGLALQELYISEQAAIQEKLLREQQQIKESAAESEQLFKALFEKTYSPVLIHENGRILAINEIVTEVFGYLPDMLVGKLVQTLIQSLVPLPEQKKIVEHIQAGSEQPYQTKCFQQGGTIVPVEIIPQKVSYKSRSVDMVVLRPLQEVTISTVENLEEIRLSERQNAILAYMVSGMTYKEIAKRLQISLSTVHYHKQTIYDKLQVSSKVEAVAKAVQMGVTNKSISQTRTPNYDGEQT